MSAPVKVNLSSLSGPWQALSVTGATGAGTAVNLVFSMIAGLLNSGNQWTNDTKTVTRHTNGDWLIKSGSTVLYRKVGSVTWPWSSGTWTGENGATGTIVLAQQTAVPSSSPDIVQAYPSLLSLSGVVIGEENGTWMNGEYSQTDDVISLPAWYRSYSSIRRALIRAYDDTPHYEIATQLREDVEDPWADDEVVFVPDSPSIGMPWRVGWIADGSYSGDPTIVKTTSAPVRVEF